MTQAIKCSVCACLSLYQVQVFQQAPKYLVHLKGFASIFEPEQFDWHSQRQQIIKTQLSCVSVCCLKSFKSFNTTEGVSSTGNAVYSLGKWW